MPRRRWVGSTEMAVRPPIGMVVSPGRVRSIEKAPPVPTMRSPSKAPMLRSYSNHRSWSASSSSVNVSPKAVARTPLNWSPWSGVIGRMSMSMGPLYWKRPGRTPPFRPVSSAAHGADPRSRPGPGRPASGVGLVPGRSLGAGRAVRAERARHRPAGAGRDGQEPRLLPLPPGRPARHPAAGRRRDGAAGARHLDGGGAGRARHGRARAPPAPGRRDRAAHGPGRRGGQEDDRPAWPAPGRDRLGRRPARGRAVRQPVLAAAVASLPDPGPAGLRAAVPAGLPHLGAGPAGPGRDGPRPPPVVAAADRPPLVIILFDEF